MRCVSCDQNGVLQIPLALLLLVIAAASFGTWAILHRWNQLARTQLRLDRCVSQRAVELRTLQNRLVASNLAIRGTRAALAAANLAPPAKPPLEAALAAEVLFQDVELASWNLRRALWISLQGCTGIAAGDRAWPLPEAGWTRPPRDAVGDQPLSRSAVFETEPKLRIRIRHGTRNSSAEVSTHATEKWSARWIPFGPSLD